MTLVFFGLVKDIPIALITCGTRHSAYGKITAMGIPPEPHEHKCHIA